MTITKGRCQCGGVEFTVNGPLRDVVYCHCKMCRRLTGHLVAATACAPSHLSMEKTGTLRWYASSPEASRGFCGNCGSNLFWKPASGAHVSIWAGSLDEPTGIKAAAHIYVEAKGDYYTIDDGLPQHIGGEHDVRLPVDAG